MAHASLVKLAVRTVYFTYSKLYMPDSGSEIMRTLRPGLIYVAIVVLVVLGLLASALIGEQTGGEIVVAGLAIPVIVAAGIGAYLLRKNRERQTGAGARGGIEISRARRAQAGAFVDAVLGGLLISSVLLLTEVAISASLTFMLFSVALVCDFWIRYMILRLRDGS